MKLDETAITILVNREFTTIELIDKKSNITFAKVTLTPEQFSSALSRTAYTDCAIEVAGLDKLNKLMEVQKIEFPLPKTFDKYSQDRKSTFEIGKTYCPEGWVMDDYFSSQDSFFEKDGKRFARTCIRRWV